MAEAIKRKETRTVTRLKNFATVNGRMAHWNEDMDKMDNRGLGRPEYRNVEML